MCSKISSFPKRLVKRSVDHKKIQALLVLGLVSSLAAPGRTYFEGRISGTTTACCPAIQRHLYAHADGKHRIGRRRAWDSHHRPRVAVQGWSLDQILAWRHVTACWSLSNPVSRLGKNTAAPLHRVCDDVCTDLRAGPFWPITSKSNTSNASLRNRLVNMSSRVISPGQSRHIRQTSSEQLADIVIAQVLAAVQRACRATRPWWVVVAIRVMCRKRTIAIGCFGRFAIINLVAYSIGTSAHAWRHQISTIWRHVDGMVRHHVMLHDLLTRLS